MTFCTVTSRVSRKSDLMSLLHTKQVLLQKNRIQSQAVTRENTIGIMNFSSRVCFTSAVLSQVKKKDTAKHAGP